VLQTRRPVVTTLKAEGCSCYYLLEEPPLLLVERCRVVFFLDFLLHCLVNSKATIWLTIAANKI